MPAPNASPLLAAIAWNPAGLVPCVAQQHDTGEVPMLAWMDRATGRRSCFFVAVRAAALAEIAAPMVDPAMLCGVAP